MSAETIPADVQVLAKIETFEKDYAGSIYIGGAHLNRHLWPLLQEVRAILTDRSTRPAEPAAPAAEAGDGDVAASLAHLNIGYLYGIADALEHTDFTRAGDIRQCLLQVVKGLSASATTLEAERARADAAEQRAADALARAEKAAEDERDRLYTKAQASNTAEFLIRHGAMLPADRARLRALREAQPATDGGEA